MTSAVIWHEIGNKMKENELDLHGRAPWWSGRANTAVNLDSTHRQSAAGSSDEVSMTEISDQLFDL